MTNREKYLDEILAVNCCSDVKKKRTGSKDCTEGCGECHQRNIKWLQEEYHEKITKHDDCYYCKKIEDLAAMRYCSKRNHSINGAEPIISCKDFKER